MTRWFVYSNERYYPEGTIVDADTPEEALKTASARDTRAGALVFKLEDAALTVEPTRPDMALGGKSTLAESLLLDDTW